MDHCLGGQGRENAMKTMGFGAFSDLRGVILGVIFGTNREAKLVQGLGTGSSRIGGSGEKPGSLLQLLTN